MVWVAELDGAVAGAMAAMPYDDWTPRAHRFLRVTLSSIPPWRWPGALWLYRSSGRTAPEPAAALASTWTRWPPSAGTAAAAWPRALLDEAERQARDAGLRVAWRSTPGQDNRPARALYRARGFEEVGRRARGQRPAGRRVAAEGACRRAPRAASAATRSTWPRSSSGKNGSASDRAATSSHTGNSPSRWPKRSR